MLNMLAASPRKLALGASLACIGVALLLAFVLGRGEDAPLPTREAAAAVVVAPSPAEVMHFWNAGSERDALDEIRDAYVAQGGVWIDNPQGDHSALRRALVERLSTNTPPVAVLWQSNVELRDLAEMGVFSSLDTVAVRENWDAVLPPAVRARIQIDGHYYMAPTNLHGMNWIFYNAPLLARLHIAEPRTWPELLEAMHQVRRAGVRPIAIGWGDWEVQLMFGTILLGTLGRENYRRLIEHQDATVLNGPGALEAFRTFGAIRDMARRDAFYDSWAEASHAVGRGEAAFQFMGDWAKAEMIRTGALPGREIGCMLAPGSRNALVLTIDGFAFPTPPNAARETARDNLASIVFNREGQVRFAAKKGAMAARTDVPPSHPDQCEAIMIERLRDPAAPVAPPDAGLPSAPAGDFLTTVSRFFNDPNMTPEEAHAGLVAAFR